MRLSTCFLIFYVQFLQYRQLREDLIEFLACWQRAPPVADLGLARPLLQLAGPTACGMRRWHLRAARPNAALMPARGLALGPDKSRFNVAAGFGSSETAM